MKSQALQTPIEYLKGVGPQRATLLRQELGIETFQDLLHLFPNRYIDRTQYHKISELQGTATDVQLVGKIVSVKMIDQKEANVWSRPFRMRLVSWNLFGSAAISGSSNL